MISRCVRGGFWVWLSLLLFPSGAPLQSPSSLQRFEYSQLHMGVRVRLAVYASRQSDASSACAAAFQRIAAIEQIMSDYRPTSELMRLCARAGGPPVRVSPELFLVLARARALSRRSGGAFDVTIGPYAVLWREARKSRRLPSAAALARARARVGWQKMHLDAEARTVRLTVPGMRLDLGGIAKGYALDCALDTLRKHGITRALAEAGGDIVVSGPPPSRQGWRIETARQPTRRAARRPQPDPTPLHRVLKHAAVSTSGGAEQFVEIAGRRYSHIIDPRTGLGLTHPWTATVVAQDGMTADSLATAACVLGPRRGAALVRSFPGASVFFHKLPFNPSSVGARALGW